MGKLLLVTLNLLVLAAFKILFGGDVMVNQNFPAAVKPGEKFNIEIEIEKGDHEGFAKWQQKLPNGFIASTIETEGATFSFKNQEVKIIWMALPEAEKFTIKYAIETSAEFEGEFNLDGKFSFIEENDRKEVVAPSKKITITKDADILASKSDEKETESNVNTQNVSKKSQAKNGSGEVVSDENGIKIIRTITHIAEGNYEVDLKLTKGDLVSFGKIEEFVPPNYEASSIDNGNGIFSFDRKVMKILWMTLPEENEINITYGLKSTSNELDSAMIFGVFSYLKVDESKQQRLDGSKFRNYLSPLPEPIVEEIEETKEEETSEGLAESVDPIEEETDAEEQDTMDPASETSDAMQTVVPPTENIDENTANNIEDDVKEVDPVSEIPNPETNVTYKVQIAAAKKEVDQQYFVQRHKIKEEVSILYHENWYKYTVGAYNVYKEARDKRNKIWGDDNKINDAFVTAYNEGNRITVQEALMITKQKWYN